MLLSADEQLFGQIADLSLHSPFGREALEPQNYIIGTKVAQKNPACLLPVIEIPEIPARMRACPSLRGSLLKGLYSVAKHSTPASRQMGYCCRIFTPVQQVYPAASRGIFFWCLQSPAKRIPRKF